MGIKRVLEPLNDTAVAGALFDYLCTQEKEVI